MASNYLQKGRSARSIFNWISCYKSRVMKENLQILAENTYTIDKRRKKVLKIAKRSQNKLLSSFFYNWKNTSELLGIAEDQLESGHKRIELKESEINIQKLMDLSCNK